MADAPWAPCIILNTYFYAELVEELAARERTPGHVEAATQAAHDKALVHRWCKVSQAR